MHCSERQMEAVSFKSRTSGVPCFDQIRASEEKKVAKDYGRGGASINCSSG